MPGATASASESARPDDIPSCSFVEHLPQQSGVILKKLDMFELVFLGYPLPMGGSGVPSHLMRSCRWAAHLNDSSHARSPYAQVVPPWAQKACHSGSP